MDTGRPVCSNHPRSCHHDTSGQNVQSVITRLNGQFMAAYIIDKYRPIIARRSTNYMYNHIVEDNLLQLLYYSHEVSSSKNP